MSGTCAVAVQTAAAPHAARFRPSDGAIAALGAFHVDMIIGPETFCSVPLTMKSSGSGRLPYAFTCVEPLNGSVKRHAVGTFASTPGGDGMFKAPEGRA